MGKTKIDWCDEVRNPVWGCKHGCEYCYARKFAYRMSFNDDLMDHFKKADKNINIDDIRNFKPTWIESNFVKPFPKKPSRIFVDSMSDIAFWKPEWFKRVIIKISQNPQHTFIFLTKAPKIYSKYHFPSNCWLGVTVTGVDDVNRSIQLESQKNNLTFISLEPMLTEDVLAVYFQHNWIIAGLETGRKGVFIPQIENIELIIDLCEIHKIPLFMKESMKKVWGEELIQEFPELNIEN